MKKNETRKKMLCIINTTTDLIIKIHDFAITFNDERKKIYFKINSVLFDALRGFERYDCNPFRCKSLVVRFSHELEVLFRIINNNYLLTYIYRLILKVNNLCDELEFKL